MSKDQLTAALTEILESDIDGSTDLWPAVRERVGVSKSNPTPVFRLAQAAAIAVIIIFGSVTAVVARSNLDRAASVDPEIDAIYQSGLITPVEQAQTIDGVSVTIHWVYADPVRVLVAYSTDAGGRERFRAGTTIESLLLADGTSLQPVIGTGYVASDTQRANIMSFVAPAEAASEGVLDGRLAVKVFDESAMLYIVRDENGAVLHESIEMGTLTFDVRIPVTAGRVFQEQQIISAEGQAVRLERLVIAPTGTSVDVCFDDPGIDGYQWTVVGEIITEGKTLYNNFSHRSEADPLCQTNYFWDIVSPDASFYTVRMTDIIGFKNEIPGEQRRISGPWVFAVDTQQ
jgi:hypothetical protein